MAAPDVQEYSAKDEFLKIPGVKDRLEKLATKHGFTVNEILTVIQKESNFETTAKNPKSKATGLIQFMPDTAKALGTTIEKIKEMDALSQLEIVDKYFTQNHTKGQHPYVTVAYPAAAKMDMDDIIAPKDSIIAKQNPVWQNEDGNVTKRSILGYVGAENRDSKSEQEEYPTITPADVGKVRRNGTEGGFNGKGTYNWPDGDKYVGEWKDGMMHGQGTVTWPSGSKYAGEFKDDNLHGKGTYTWPDGTKYVGQWNANNKHGQGTFTWADGEKYEGEFKDDNFHGKGTITKADGTVRGGYWENDEFIGEYKSHNYEDIQDARVNSNLFEDGDFVTIKGEEYRYDKDNDSLMKDIGQGNFEVAFELDTPKSNNEDDGTSFKVSSKDGETVKGEMTYYDGSKIKGTFKQDENGNLILNKGTFTTPDGEEIKDVNQEKLDNLIVSSDETTKIFEQNEFQNKRSSDYDGKSVYYKTLNNEEEGAGVWRPLEEGVVPSDAVMDHGAATWVTGDGITRTAVIGRDGKYYTNDRYDDNLKREVGLGIREDAEVGPSTGPPQGQSKFKHNGITYYGDDDTKAFITRTEDFSDQWLRGADQEILAELGITDISQMSDPELVTKYQEAYNVKNGFQEDDDNYLEPDGKFGENTMRTSEEVNNLFSEDKNNDGIYDYQQDPAILTDTDPNADVNTGTGTGQRQKPKEHSLAPLGKAIQSTLQGAGSLLDSVGGPGAIISYIMGKKGLKAAMKEVEPLQSPELSPMFMQHLRQTRELAKKGFHPDQARKFRSEIDMAYGKSLENAVRGSGGQRAKFLAQTGVLDAQRSAALLDYAAKDAEMQTKNADKYEKMMLFKENFDLQRTEQQRAEDMARQVADKKAAAGFTSSAFTSLMTSYASGRNSSLANQFAKGATDFYNNLTTIGLNTDDTNLEDPNQINLNQGQ